MDRRTDELPPKDQMWGEREKSGDKTNYLIINTFAIYMYKDRWLHVCSIVLADIMYKYFTQVYMTPAWACI